MDSRKLLDKIKPHARPTWSAEVDDLAARAETNGWTLDALADELNRGIGPNTGTGYVIGRLRSVSSVRRSNGRDETTTATGPCQLGCDHGWFTGVDDKAVPCRSCRPDTYRRVAERARLLELGAPSWRTEQAMTTEAAPGPVPHTYPLPSTPTPLPVAS